MTDLDGFAAALTEAGPGGGRAAARASAWIDRSRAAREGGAR